MKTALFFHDSHESRPYTLYYMGYLKMLRSVWLYLNWISIQDTNAVLQTFSSCAPASFVHVCNPLRAFSRALYHIYAGINTIAPQILTRFSCTSVGLLPLARSLRTSYRHKSNCVKSGERVGHLRGAALAI